MSKKILTVLGARPQFIKAATVSREIKNYNKSKLNYIEEKIIHTGQHFDRNMSEVFFDTLQIPKPYLNLHISSLSHGAMTGRMIEKIEEVLTQEKPNLLVVYGDTNSTLAGAIAASKLKIPVAHIEAGLRSFNLEMPEEINRILTDRISNFLFCPSDLAIKNLKNEGYPNQLYKNEFQTIKNFGDVMYDAAIFYKAKAEKNKVLIKNDLKSKEYILCTIHRQENIENESKLFEIFHALAEIQKKVQIVFPVHPRTKNIITSKEWFQKLNLIKFINPQPYLEMQKLIMDSHLIITDSGGIQKEAYFHQVQCITVRKETEWMETIDLGWNCLVEANKEKLVNLFNRRFKKIPFSKKIYGDGKSAKYILNEIINNI